MTMPRGNKTCLDCGHPIADHDYRDPCPPAQPGFPRPADFPDEWADALARFTKQFDHGSAWRYSADLHLPEPLRSAMTRAMAREKVPGER